MKTVRNILILAILLLIIYAILKHYNILKLQKVQEGFTDSVWSGVDKYFGNCIYNNNNPENNDSVLNINYNNPSVEIRLPGDYKITGFKVDLFNNDDTPITDNDIESDVKYSFSVGNDVSNMVDVVNDYGFNKFKFNTDVKDVKLFENEDGTSKYNGRNVTITLQNLKGKDGVENMDKSKQYKLKVQIYGLDVYALNAKTYGNYIPTTHTITSDNKITFGSNKKIVAINMISNVKNDILKIVYDNDYDSNKRKYIGVGPINQGFDTSIPKGTIIYFNKPIIAKTIYFKKLKDGTDIDVSGSIKVYYSEVSRRDEVNFKFDKQLESNDKLGIAIQGEKCPGVNQIMRRQMQAQQLCEALEYKDRIRNSKVVYEKEKTYLKKLAQQEKELQDLEKLINSLVARKNDRIKNNKHHSVEALDKELRKIEEVRKQAETDLLEGKKAHDLKVELNLEPEFTDILAKYNLD